MWCLKEKSSLIIFEQFSNLKYKYGNRRFLCKGYFVSTVGINEDTILRYIFNQEEHDKISGQHSLAGHKDHLLVARSQRRSRNMYSLECRWS